MDVGLVGMVVVEARDAMSLGDGRLLENEKEWWSGEWYLTRWWRVIDADGKLWCETSNGQEAREAMRPGDRLQCLWERIEHEWRAP